MPFSSTPEARRLRVLCLASLCWAFNFGVGAPLASLWLQDAGYSSTIIGLNTGIYYLGIAITAIFVPWLIRNWKKRCLLLGLVAAALTVAWFPWGHSLFGWFLLRALNGVAGALSLIPMETLVNQNSPPEQRSRDFGYYAFCVALGIALGMAIGVQMYSGAPTLAFLLGGATSLFAAAIVLRYLEWPEAVKEEQLGSTPLEFRRNFLSFGSAWSQGFLEGGMVSLVPMYLLWVGLTESGVGWLMGGIMVGVIAFQVPVAWLADRYGRTTVMLGCYLVTAINLAVLMSGVNVAGLAVCLFLAGACSAAFYPLGLSILGERLSSSALPRASAWYLAINCIGSLCGPVLSGITMDLFGNHAIFAAGEAAVLFILISWACLRLIDWLRSSKTITPLPTTVFLETREAA